MSSSPNLSYFETDGHRYDLDVYNGVILANKHIIRRAERNIEFAEHHLDTATGLPKPDSPWMFDFAKARKQVEFNRRILEIPVKVKGSTDTHSFFNPLPWQLSALEKLQGWRATNIPNIYGIWPGERMIRELLIDAAKACGKTPLLAAIVLFELVNNKAENFKVFCLAFDKEQAQITCDVIQDMIRRIQVRDKNKQPDDKILKYVVTTRASAKGSGPGVVLLKGGQTYYFNKEGREAGFIVPIDGSGKGTAGHEINIGVFDEISQYEQFEAMSEVVDSFKSNREPLSLKATNPGKTNATIYRAERMKAEQILYAPLGSEFYNPTIDMMLYGMEEEMNETDPNKWIVGNPSARTTVGDDYFIAGLNKKKYQPQLENEVNRLYFGKPSKDEELNFTVGAWEACLVDIPIVGKGKLIVSVDFAILQDMLAVCILDNECAQFKYWWNEEALKKKYAATQEMARKEWIPTYVTISKGPQNDLDAFAMWFALKMKKEWKNRDVHVIFKTDHRDYAHTSFRRAGFPITGKLQSNGIIQGEELTFHQSTTTADRDNPINMNMGLNVLRAWVNENILKIVKNPILEYNRSCVRTQIDRLGNETIIIDVDETSQALVDGLSALVPAVCLANHYLLGDDDDVDDVGDMTEAEYENMLRVEYGERAVIEYRQERGQHVESP